MFACWGCPPNPPKTGLLKGEMSQQAVLLFLRNSGVFACWGCPPNPPKTGLLKGEMSQQVSPGYSRSAATAQSAVAA
ncbi:hypothetical protein VF08_22900, partial [Nostoc linckia z8]